MNAIGPFSRIVHFTQHQDRHGAKIDHYEVLFTTEEAFQHFQKEGIPQEWPISTYYFCNKGVHLISYTKIQVSQIFPGVPIQQDPTPARLNDSRFIEHLSPLQREWGIASLE